MSLKIILITLGLGLLANVFYDLFKKVKRFIYNQNKPFIYGII